MNEAANQARGYVSAMRAAGCTDAAIAAELRKVGWDSGQVQALFGPAEGRSRRAITVRQIISAIYKDDLSKIRRRLQEGADPNAKSGEEPWDTPLHQAALLSSCKATELLLQHGASVTATDHHGDTPLHIAALSGAADVLQVLLEHGADANAVNGRGDTPLLMATYAEHDAPDAARVLIEHGAVVDYAPPQGRSALDSAVANRHVQIVRVLLQGRATYSLSAACLLNDVGAAREFVAMGVDPDTGIHVAASQGHTALVGTLLDAGANAGALDDRDRTPLHEAVYGEHLSTAELLLQRGADPNVKAKRIGRPLKRALGACPSNPC